MANNSFRGSKRGRRAEANHSAPEFSVSVKELQALMELKGSEGAAHIQEVYGDVGGLCAKLRTSPINGTTSSLLHTQGGVRQYRDRSLRSR